MERLTLGLRAALLLALLAAHPAVAQQIDEFRIAREAEGGRTWLRLGWSVSGTDKVVLLEDGREVPSRIQLSDGTFGWPSEMPNAFRVQSADGDFTLVVETSQGPISARGRYNEDGCLAWLSPPDTHWQRCRPGGLIAENLAPATSSNQPATCSGEGRVRSTVGYSVMVPDSPLVPNSPTTRFDLDRVFLLEEGSDQAVSLPLGPSGSERSYRFSGLEGGRAYIVALYGGWRGDPAVVRIRCPATPGDSRVAPQPILATGFSSD